MNAKLPRQIFMLKEIYTAYENQDLKISPGVEKTAILLYNN